MGVLTVLHLPAKNTLGTLDHTYVECASGVVGWGCFGHKHYGTV